MALAETGGPQLGELLRDAARYLRRGRVLLPAGPGRRTVGVLIDKREPGELGERPVAPSSELDIPWD